MKNNLDEGITTLIQDSEFIVTFDDMLHLGRRLPKSNLIKEVLHLVMRLVKPKEDVTKYDCNQLKKKLLSTTEETSKMLQNICYSEISSKVYKEVLKRFRLWKINDQANSEPKLSPYIQFLNKTLDFLKVRED